MSFGNLKTLYRSQAVTNSVSRSLFLVANLGRCPQLGSFKGCDAFMWSSFSVKTSMSRQNLE